MRSILGVHTVSLYTIPIILKKLDVAPMEDKTRKFHKDSC